jgi:polar amino acid transport system substrate-binding protein
MDDERIERALRAGPADDPSYVQLGVPVPGHHRREGRSTLRVAFELLGTVAVAGAIIVSIVVLRTGDQAASAPDVLAAIRASGTLRVAVSSGSPQVFVTGTGLDGFDLDVARAIGKRLGVEVEISAVEPAQVEAGGWNGAWDLAIDSQVSTARRAAGLDVGGRYYTRTGAIVVPKGSPISRPTDLSESSVCIVDGSLAQRWVAGSLDLVDGTAAEPPTGVKPVVRTSQDKCIAAVADGSAAAYVSDWTMDVEPPDAGFAILAEAPFAGAASVAVDRGRAGSSQFLAEIDRIVAAMQSDGTLRTLSERRFGGRDLTISPGG